MFNYHDKHLEFLHEFKSQGTPWKQITKEFNKKFKCDQSGNALRKAYHKYYELLLAGIPEVDTALLRNARTAARTSAKNRKALNIALDTLEAEEDIVEKISKLIHNTKFSTLPTVDITHRDPSATNMIMEVLLSDLHYGKKTDTFNYKKARQLMQELVSVIIDQYKMQVSLGFNVLSIDIALLGDIIESSTMHGPESLKSCEFGNSEQVVAAIESLFLDVFVPLGKLGVKLNANCVTGNHGRTAPQKTFIKPGKEYQSWIIYNTLEMLCNQANINTCFTIAEDATILHKIFDDYVLYEHFDLVGACTKKALTEMLSKRQTQFGEIINFYRGGHWHEYTVFDRGRIIINGCLPGEDGYSQSFGYSTESVQAINFYCENKDRPNSYYYTFPVFLGAKKKRSKK